MEEFLVLVPPPLCQNSHRKILTGHSHALSTRNNAVNSKHGPPSGAGQSGTWHLPERDVQHRDKQEEPQLKSEQCVSEIKGSLASACRVRVGTMRQEGVAWCGVPKRPRAWQGSCSNALAGSL